MMCVCQFDHELRLPSQSDREAARERERDLDDAWLKMDQDTQRNEAAGKWMGI